MKKLSFILTFLIGATSLFAQDKVIKHDRDTLSVKVIRVTDVSIVFKYEGEEAEQMLGRLAVKKIRYGSGRTEEISEKYVVSGKDEWEKVQVVTDREMVAGLKKGEEIRGKTSGILSYNTAGSADKKAMRKLMEAAAEAGFPIVLITSDNDARVLSGGLGAQGLKKGILYSYK
jgi:hypothetical protein